MEDEATSAERHALLAGEDSGSELPTRGAAAVNVHRRKLKWSRCAAANLGQFLLDEVAESSVTEERAQACVTLHPSFGPYGQDSWRHISRSRKETGKSQS